MRRLGLNIVFHFLFALVARAQADTILDRYSRYLLRTSVLPVKHTANWIRTLQPDGRWPDIDYNDKEPAAWKVPDHLKRIRDMALCWAASGSPERNSIPLLHAMEQALDHWLLERYRSTNWWHNEIGIPRYMRDIIILLRKQLNPQRMNAALEVLNQLRVHEDYLAGNLVWCADLGLHYGALTGDDALVQRCRNLIVKEIKVDTGEGIQPDYSFQQHGHRLQMYQYGKAFLLESLRVAWQLKGTELAFPEDKVALLTGMMLNGWQWMARGIYTVPGTMDRSASRKGELESADVRALIPFMKELQPSGTADWDRLSAVQNGKTSLLGFRYYPYSDFAAYHRKAFSFFLKTISTRTLATESINHENLKGRLLNSGDAYLIRDGKEYTDLMSVWDWSHLPGVTAFKGAYQANRQAFAGSAGDSLCGVTAMHVIIADTTGKQTLAAHKFWACYGDKVVCLVGDLKTDKVPDPVYTALDQCRLRGPVTVNHPKQVLRNGTKRLDQVRWIHHAGFAYIPLQPAVMEVHAENMSGTWYAINNAESKNTVRADVFMPVLWQQQGSSFGYVLSAATTAEQAAKLASKPDWKVLQNDKDVQAVRFADGVVMAAFYEPGKLLLEQGRYLQTDRFCLVVIKKGKLYVSDPLHKGGMVTLQIGNKEQQLQLQADGTTATVVFN
ncbi:polysaccharide lyase beta-sandwich domain-containing protein [Niabella sp. CC-SYL272]|uniref:polysaccharide lyase family 8 super-sandwich domain-containing protein n=1 Tax=Niabella agricola TaxID=2891571 RepID=UPI001F412D44|nr:polysaccharide lyase family 8 super-sandwich domain-containing protein [Niabella agricola]MCF3111920.1 polysaccharide lyase beta-sandwich domain-containing protein [Niabella agricola]